MENFEPRIVKKLKEYDVKVLDSEDKLHALPAYINFYEAHNLQWWNELPNTMKNHLPGTRMIIHESDYYFRFKTKEDMVKFLVTYG